MEHLHRYCNNIYVIYIYKYICFISFYAYFYDIKYILMNF